MRGQRWGGMERAWGGLCSTQHARGVMGREQKAGREVSSLDWEKKYKNLIFLSPGCSSALAECLYRGLAASTPAGQTGMSVVPSLAGLGGSEGQRLVGLETSLGTSWRTQLRGPPPLTLKSAEVGSGDCSSSASVPPASSLIL